MFLSENVQFDLNCHKGVTRYTTGTGSGNTALRVVLVTPATVKHCVSSMNGAQTVTYVIKETWRCSVTCLDLVTALQCYQANS